MKMDWAALGMVAVVSIGMAVLFTILLAAGIRAVSAARLQRNRGGTGTAVLASGYTLLGLAALLALFGIWLIVPQFH